MKDGIKLTSLWKNKTEKGQEYFSGYLGDAKLMIFPNGYKKEDKHPDYIVYLVPNKKKDEKQTFDRDRPDCAHLQEEPPTSVGPTGSERTFHSDEFRGEEPP